jgi:hypothetical protein
MWHGAGLSYRVLVGKTERKIAFRIATHRFEDNIKMYLEERGWITWTVLSWLISI